MKTDASITAPAWAPLLPGYGPGRVISDAAFTNQFPRPSPCCGPLRRCRRCGSLPLTQLTRLEGVALTQTREQQDKENRRDRREHRVQVPALCRAPHPGGPRGRAL